MKTVTPEKKIEMVFLKRLIEYQKHVRQERRETFEAWDRNSVNLIAQYEKELSQLEASQ